MIQICALIKKIFKISLQAIGRIKKGVVFAPGINKNGSAGEFNKCCASLANINKMNPHLRAYIQAGNKQGKYQQVINFDFHLLAVYFQILLCRTLRATCEL